jgi:hypothetical protein
VHGGILDVGVEGAGPDVISKHELILPWEVMCD